MRGRIARVVARWRGWPALAAAHRPRRRRAVARGRSVRRGARRIRTRVLDGPFAARAALGLGAAAERLTTGPGRVPRIAAPPRWRPRPGRARRARSGRSARLNCVRAAAMPRYRPDVLDELAPSRPRAAARYASRSASASRSTICTGSRSARCATGAGPASSRPRAPARVVELRKRYLLLSIPRMVARGTGVEEQAGAHRAFVSGASRPGVHSPHAADHVPYVSDTARRAAPPGDLGRSAARRRRPGFGPSTRRMAARRSACSVVRRAPTR